MIESRPRSARPFLACLALALLFACAHRPAEIVLTEADDGRTITIREGATLLIRLAANPTTGYRWTLARTPSRLTLAGDDALFEPASEPPRLGAGGHQLFRFTATAPGRETLELIHARSWEEAPPLAVYRVTIEIRAANGTDLPPRAD
jgi:inhibitor of cysteine peptidase